MKLLRNQKESVRHIFDSYCKKILRQENAGMKRSEVRRRAREYSLSELPPELFEKLRYEDVHPMVFEVCGYRIPVNDDRLAAALAALLREKRDVFLLSYFMDMTERLGNCWIWRVGPYSIDGQIPLLNSENEWRMAMTNLLHTKCVRNKTLLPFSVIHAASQGDEAAICCILKHYEGYIRRLATRCFYDAAGNLYYFVDEAVRGQLEIKLIESILKFDIIRIA